MIDIILILSTTEEEQNIDLDSGFIKFFYKFVFKPKIKYLFIRRS